MDYAGPTQRDLTAQRSQKYFIHQFPIVIDSPTKGLSFPFSFMSPAGERSENQIYTFSHFSRDVINFTFSLQPHFLSGHTQEHPGFEFFGNWEKAGDEKGRCCFDCALLSQLNHPTNAVLFITRLLRVYSKNLDILIQLVSFHNKSGELI